MLGNSLSLRYQPQNAVFAAASARRLAAALSELPAGWQVLRNRRLRAIDGPPWVKFVALHPDKGIALIDLLPAIPEAAIPPLDEFLARTLFGAFAAGDLPIVAVALGDRDVAMVDRFLASAFTAAPPCGIRNRDWTEAVIELLLSARGLLLTRVAPARDQAAPSTIEEEPRPEPIANSLPLPAMAGPIIATAALDLAPAIAPVRRAWLAPAALAAIAIGTAIGFLVVDRPKPMAPAIAEIEIAAPPSPAQDKGPERSTARSAAPIPTTTKTAPRTVRRRISQSVPIWEEQSRSGNATRAARGPNPSALAER